MESLIGFQRYWLNLKRHWLPASAVFGSVFALTILSSLLQKPVYVAEGELLLKRTSTTSALTGLGKEIGQLDALQQQDSPLDTEAEILRSVPITQKTLTRLNLKDKNGEPLGLKEFRDDLSVNKIKGTDLIQVSYKDSNPQQAAEVVNTLMAVYIENNVLVNRAEAVAAREFVQKQLPRAEANLRQADLELRRFQEQNQIINLAEESRTAVDIVANLQEKINQTQTELADAQAQSAVIKGQLNQSLPEATSVTSISQSPAVQDLLKEVQKVESQLVTERSRFREDHPIVVSLKNQKANLERLLQARVKKAVGVQRANANGDLQSSQFEQDLTEELFRIEAKRVGLTNQIATLSKLRSAYDQRLSALPQLEQKQRELERKLQAAQATYSLLSQKFEEIKIAENQQVGNARVISAALVPQEPIARRQGFNTVAGILLGGMLSVATATVLEARDKSLKTVEAVRQAFGLTVLGMIPQLKSERINLRDGNLELPIPELVIKNSPHSSCSQAYRMLQANLKFLSYDQKLKVFVVTSSVPKEGKSTVSANLAVAMAQLGRKVLLVDADMHHPLQHRIWELPNSLGLSNLLVGQTEVKTAIRKVMTNLHVLTAGVTPPNPMALLDSQRMASLMEIFAANYDFTIIDTPPLSVAAEAPILGKMAGSILLVVRPEVVDTVSAARAKEFLEQSHQNVVGMVVNGVVSENEPYTYYHSSKPEQTEGNAFPIEDVSLGLTARNR